MEWGDNCGSCHISLVLTMSSDSVTLRVRSFNKQADLTKTWNHGGGGVIWWPFVISCNEETFRWELNWMFLLFFIRQCDRLYLSSADMCLCLILKGVRTTLNAQLALKWTHKIMQAQWSSTQKAPNHSGNYSFFKKKCHLSSFVFMFALGETPHYLV